jgi:hypothetical protein
MSQQELLKRVVQILDHLGVAYMVTGSVTSSLQGEPRSTHDIDFVVDLAGVAATRVFGAFPPDDFYVSERAIREALARRTTFNLIDLAGGDKVDFWLLTEEPFDRSRFARRRTIEALGLRFPVSTPEDTILMKLLWAERSGGSEKQFTDALRVYEVQHGNLDLVYMNEWAGRLGIEALWRRLCDEAAPL